MYFRGGDPAKDREIAEEWKKWHFFFSAFNLCADARYGNLLHLPHSGGAMEQGARTGEIFVAIQAVFRELLAQEQNKIFKNK